MKLFQSFLLTATLSEAQRAKKRKVLKSKLVWVLFSQKILPILHISGYFEIFCAFGHFEIYENFCPFFSVSIFTLFESDKNFNFRNK